MRVVIEAFPSLTKMISPRISIVFLASLIVAGLTLALVAVCCITDHAHAQGAQSLKPVLHIYYDLPTEDSNGADFRKAYVQATRSNRPPLVGLRVPVEVDRRRVRVLPLNFDNYSVVVATSEALAESVRLTHATVPLVFLSHSDPRRSGLVESFNRPGRNATGFTYFRDILAKRFEVLKALVPEARKVGVLIDRGVDFGADFESDVALAAMSVGLKAKVVVCDTWTQAEREIRRSAEEGYDAWDFPATHLAEQHSRELLNVLNEIGIPAIHSYWLFVRDGGFAAFEATGIDAEPTLARAVSLILDGASASEIPLQQQSGTWLTLNATAAAKIGRKFSDRSLALAHKVYR